MAEHSTDQRTRRGWTGRMVALSIVVVAGIIGAGVLADHLYASSAQSAEPAQTAAPVAAAVAASAESTESTDDSDSDVTQDLPAAVPATKVLTIGDSIMKGFGLSTEDAWPALLAARFGWDLTTLACNGAGFITPGGSADCGENYSGVIDDAAGFDPDVIIIQGSSNDFGHSNSALLATTLADLEKLHAAFPNARIIGLSTVWSETTPPAQLDDINAQVQQAVEAVGGTYYDIGQPLSDHAEWMQRDDVHPTADGQVALADAIEAALY